VKSDEVTLVASCPFVGAAPVTDCSAVLVSFAD
jgi:hypothetical protein